MMKQIIVLGIEENRKEMHQLMQKAGAQIFSEVPIKGFRNETQTADRANWFAGHTQAVYSELLFSFVDEAVADRILESIKAFNESKKTNYPLHGFVMPLEKFV